MRTFRDLHEYIRSAERNGIGMHYPGEDGVTFHIYNGFTQVNIIVGGVTHRNIIFNSDNTVSVAIVSNEVAKYDIMPCYDIDCPINSAADVLGAVVNRILHRALGDIDYSVDVMDEEPNPEDIGSLMNELNVRMVEFNSFRDGYRRSYGDSVVINDECEEHIREMAAGIFGLIDNIVAMDPMMNENLSSIVNEVEREVAQANMALEFLSRYLTR